ncbi:MAG: penicillin-binding protein 1A [Onishia taeanensis]|uniref:penicillin-binding protein 1A n=1 Tax=Onishia taeanensis TaxID=284577 RepID=UPI003C798A72
MKLFKTLAASAIWITLSLSVSGVLALVGAALYFAPGLPDVRQLQDFELQTPLRIYTRDDKLIGEFGEERRLPVSYDEIPKDMIDALLSAEDAGFFEHPGVDPKGLLRAATELVASGGDIQSGGSTITMQVARNYLLTLDRTFTRKIREILLALQMEQVLSKEEILTLYVNKIFLGHRSYGIGAAAETYYGKPLSELSLAQTAMIAGLPKAPSNFNPLANPERSLIRRNWILYRMRELGHIDAERYETAVKAPITARRFATQLDVDADYVAEMARQFVVDHYDDAYTGGYKVTTTLDSQLQPLARQALTQGLIEYDTRHGWRGAEETDIPASLVEAQNRTQRSGLEEELSESEVRETARQAAERSQTQVSGIDGDVSNWLRVLERTPAYGPLEPAIVVKSEDREMRVLSRDGKAITLPWSGLEWADPYLSPYSRGRPPSSAGDIADRGSLVRILEQDDGSWRLSQLPAAEGSIIVQDPDSGAVLALQGGFSFASSKFNRATQAKRQPGSTFKPFIYLAALQQGDMTPATVINDAPVVMESNDGLWRPANSGGEFRGPTRLREALAQSRNLVTIRILRTMGLDSTIDFLTGFGFAKDQLPNGLSLALGSASLTPLTMTNAYSTLANGGFQVSPWFIKEVTRDGKVIEKAEPAVACRDCSPDAEHVERDGESYPLAQRVAEESSVYLLRSMLRDVIEHGTGRRALSLNRGDIVGKTGTTNDRRDAWFAGFNEELVTTVWVGKDNYDTIAEYGGQAALPIWMDFMGQALDGHAEKQPERPDNIVTARIDPATGQRLRDDQSGGIQEMFVAGKLPTLAPRSIDQELESQSGSQGTGSFDAIF